MQVQYKFYRNILWRIDGVFAEPADILEAYDFNCQALKFTGLDNPMVIRWIKKTDIDKGKLWFVVQDKVVKLTDLSANTRSKVRRGLKRYEVREVSREEVVRQGYHLYKKLFRFRIGKPMSYSTFARHIAGLPEEFIFYGVFDKSSGHLVGYLQIFSGARNVYLRVINILPEANKFYASYAIFFLLNNFFVDEKKKTIVLGLRSLTRRSNVQQFVVEKFHYRHMFVNFGLCMGWKASLVYASLRPFMYFLKLLKNKKAVYLSAFLQFIYSAKQRN